MGRTPRQHRAATREEVIALGQRIVAAEGLSALQARRVAGEAGCSVGTLYNLFGDLDALVFEVNARTLQRLAEAAGAALAQMSPDAPPAGRIAVLARAYVDFAHREEAAWRAVFEHRLAEGREVPDWYRARRVAPFVLLEPDLAALAPRLPAAERARAARALWAGVHGIVSIGLDEKLDAAPPEEIAAQVDLVVRAITRGLAAPQP
jgi:AcrR family transcriptional regulator